MRFSVVIPVYNKADTILETIQSVLMQSCEDREIVVVDDGSQDDLDRALQPVCEQIRIIRQKNAGVAAARNRGIQESQGEYICFLDADDLWMPEHLETLNNTIDANPGTKFVSTMYRTTFPDGTERSKLAVLSGKPDVFLEMDYFKLVLKFSTTLIHTDTVCIHRDVLREMQFEAGEKIGEDTDLWYRIAAYYPLLFIRKETAVYRRELSTATAKGTNNLDWAFARREKQLVKDATIPKTKRRHIQLLLDRWRCTCCRQLLLNGERIRAWNYITNMAYPLQKRGVYCRILYFLPQKIQKKIIKV